MSVGCICQDALFSTIEPTIGIAEARVEPDDLRADLAADRDPTPSFADGLQVQLVLDAVSRSAAADSGWQAVETMDE